MMRVAVTGATGFIGGHVLHRLRADGHEIHALSRHPLPAGPGLRTFVGDLADSCQDWSAFLDGVEVLFHCAGLSTRNAEVRAVNVEGTLRLAATASRRIRRWVQLSSLGAYGRFQQGTILETTQETPADPYECSRADADRALREMAGRSAFDLVILRPGIVFGPGMPQGFLHQWMRALRRHQFAFIGPKGASAPFIHVEDVARALLSCGFHPAAPGRTFNLALEATVEELVAGLCQGLDCPQPRLRLPLPPMRCLAALGDHWAGFPLTSSRVAALSTRVSYPIVQIQETLGFIPTVSLFDGMAAFAASQEVRA